MSENGVGKDGREGIIVLLYADNLVLYESAENQ